MPRRKRFETSDDNPDDEEQPGAAAPPPPRRSARQASKTLSTVASSKPTSKPTSISDDYGSHTLLDSGSNDNSREKSLSNAALVQKVLQMVENKDKAELMILELMREYSFSFPRLKELLTRKLTGLESLV
jgi:hypothetical protein